MYRLLASAKRTVGGLVSVFRTYRPVAVPDTRELREQEKAREQGNGGFATTGHPWWHCPSTRAKRRIAMWRRAGLRWPQAPTAVAAAMMLPPNGGRHVLSDGTFAIHRDAASEPFFLPHATCDVGLHGGPSARRERLQDSDA